MDDTELTVEQRQIETGNRKMTTLDINRVSVLCTELFTAIDFLIRYRRVIWHCVGFVNYNLYRMAAPPLNHIFQLLSNDACMNGTRALAFS